MIRVCLLILAASLALLIRAHRRNARAHADLMRHAKSLHRRERSLMERECLVRLAERRMDDALLARRVARVALGLPGDN